MKTNKKRVSFLRYIMEQGSSLFGLLSNYSEQRVHPHKKNSKRKEERNEERKPNERKERIPRLSATKKIYLPTPSTVMTAFSDLASIAAHATSFSLFFFVVFLFRLCVCVFTHGRRRTSWSPSRCQGESQCWCPSASSPPSPACQSWSRK